MDLSLAMPSWEPEATETAVPENPVFLDACRRHIADRAAKQGWVLGNSTFTQSDTWGLVWRVDFTYASDTSHSPFGNRIVFWGTPDGESLGTKVGSGWRWNERLKAKQ